jgi:hypothetical protein
LGAASTWVDGTPIEGLKCRTGSSLNDPLSGRIRKYGPSVQKAVDLHPEPVADAQGNLELAQLRMPIAVDFPIRVKLRQS